MRLAASLETGPINLGNPHEEPLRKLAERIAAIAGHGSELEFHPRPVDDPERRRPDITRARELLGWEPTVAIDDGLRMTIDWFAQRGDRS